MNLHEFFIVCPLVFLAGFVDAIAGGCDPSKGEEP